MSKASTPKDTPKGLKLLKSIGSFDDEQMKLITDYIRGIIGEDEEIKVRGGSGAYLSINVASKTVRNELRAEQRKRLEL